jgi:exopolysaccharide biosynthesis polyprenyl glycosylphosphotransferase
LSQALDREALAGLDTGEGAGAPAEKSGRARATIVSSTWARRDSAMRRMLAIADVAGLVGALALASTIAPGGAPRFELLVAALPTIPAWILLFKLYGLYDRDLKRLNHMALDDVPWLFHALVIGTLLLWAYTKLIPVHTLALQEAVLLGTGAMFLIVALRSAARRTLTVTAGPERLLVIGDGEPITALLRRIKHYSEFESVGLITGDSGAAARDIGVPVLGKPAELRRIATRLRPDRLVINRRGLTREEILEFVETARALSLKVSVLPGVVDALGTSVEVDQIDGMTILGANPPVLGRSSRLVKRGFDVLVSLTLLIPLAPVVLLSAIAIRLDSRGPVLFRQRRIGKGGRPLELLKLRTMVTGAEEQRAGLMSRSRDPRWLELDHDPRVTRVGRLLRLTGLDEIPQLWNVIRGEMSLVGPRPLPENEDRHIGGWMRGRLDLTPGMTGMWQILGPSRANFDEMVKLDYLYVSNWSLWMDVRLLLRTAPAVLRRRGAE